MSKVMSKAISMTSKKLSERTSLQIQQLQGSIGQSSVTSSEMKQAWDCYQMKRSISKLEAHNGIQATVPQDKRRQIMNNSDPSAPKTKCCSYSRKDRFSQQGLEFLFSPLHLKNITNPSHRMNFISYRQTERTGTIRQTIWQDDYKAKKVDEESFAPVCSLGSIRISCLTACTQSFQSINGSLKMAFLMSTEGGGLVAHQRFVDPIIRKSLPSKEALYGLNASSKSLAKYALEILKKHNMDNCHSIGTPLATKPKLDVDLSGEPVDQSDYCSKIRSLMYLTSSRPDFVQAVCYYARYQARPTQKHLKEVKRIFKYLKDLIMPDAFENLEKHSGGIQFLLSACKLGCTKKQILHCNVLSRGRVRCLSASCAQVMWMRTQLQDYGFNYNKIPLYCDSQSAIASLSIPTTFAKQITIHTRYQLQRNRLTNGIIELYFGQPEYQLADMFYESPSEIEHPSDTNVFTMKMEILLEPTSNKLLVGEYRDDEKDVRKSG
ncbi:hypothetical protein Tco_0425546 [Tanacetum coccineum]